MDTNNKQNQTPQSEPEQAAEQPSAEKGAATSIFDELDTQYQHKQKAPGQVQNRYAWYAVVTAVVCAVAVTAAVLVNHFRKPDPPQDPSNGDGTSSVVSQAEEEKKLVLDESIPTTATGETDADKVKAIYVTNPSDTFTIETYLGKESTLDPNTAQYIEVDTMMWNITEVAGKDIDGVKFNSSTLGFLTGDFLKLAYTSVYAENGNATIPNGSMTYFQECGLDKATTHLTVVYNDGVTKSIAVGNPTPNGTGYFVAYTYPENEVSINDKIYVVSKESVVFLLKDATYFVDSNIVEAVPQGEDTYTEDGQMVEDPYFISGALSYFDSLSISGKNYAKPFTFTIVEEEKPGYDSIYLMTSPYTQNVKLEAMDTLLAPVADGLTAYKALAMKPTSQQLKEYGLDQPACTVRYVVKNKTYVIHVGNQIDLDDATKAYAVMVDGNPSLFAADVADLGFVGMDAADFASNTIYSCNITEIKTMRFQTADGLNEIYTLTHGTDAYGNATLKVTNSAGKVIDTESFRDMYVALLGLNSFTNVTDGKDAATPALTVTITYGDYSQTDVLRLSPYTDRRYYMSLNGMGSTVVLSTSVDAVMTRIAALGQ